MILVGGCAGWCIRTYARFFFAYSVAERARRESAQFDANRRAMRLLNPMRDKMKGRAEGGGTEDTYDHGLFRRSLRIRPLMIRVDLT